MTIAVDYRAVAPDAKSGLDTAERRLQMIRESKFLGCNMEHTHLVKGLDYALLQKAKKKDKGKLKEAETKRPNLVDDSIFGDIEDYVLTLEKIRKTKQDKNADPEKRIPYFETPRIRVENRKAKRR
ncbi:protein Red [Nephila pilipes]|uniref:Protein Red n=1 Tax=Nephila pilipes TaxID=299642 RepID=A0A8X6QQN5_NEPPI|nr:protein Red [Nephila pilipes]